MTEVKTFKLYDQAVIAPLDTYNGEEKFDFKVFSGSRLLVTLYIKAIDPATTVNLDVFNTFSLGEVASEKITEISSNVIGYHKRVLTDFNKFFQLKLIVLGGNADLAIAVSVFDNSALTRIENAEIEVNLSHLNQPNRPSDSVRLGDGQYTAILNPDGSLNVNIVNAPSTNPENVVSKFNEASAVVSGAEATILGYTVPAAKKSKLQKIEFSGTNIATYTLYKNGEPMGKKHTWFNGPMFGEFSFLGTSEEGPELQAGDIIELKCVHNRPFPGDFAGRLQTIEIG